MVAKPVIGILGGIGSGKSTVAGAFAELGFVLIDADAIAHEVLNEPDAAEQLTARWGAGIVNPEGRIDRARVAAIVFDSERELEFLNRLVHPRVLDRAEEMIETFHERTKVCGIVLDIPLLLEVGWEKKCDYLVFVDCSEEKRRFRIEKKAQINVEQLKNRENFQISLDKKKLIAHYIINNNSDKSDIAEQVAQIFSSITGSK